jgi:hypothetical protein
MPQCGGGQCDRLKWVGLYTHTAVGWVLQVPNVWSTFPLMHTHFRLI